MTTAATISARLTLDSSDYDSGLDKAAGKSDSFQSKLSGMGQKMMQVGGMMTAGLTVPIVGGFAAMISSASDLNESANAMNVVFGDSGKIISDFGATSAETVGMAQSDWYQLAAVQGAALKNYGYNTDAAAEETIKLGERAADMASIFNTSVPDAMTAISALMRGETEPIKRYGVSMSQAAIEAKALEMGLIPVTKNQTEITGAQIKATEAQEKLRIATAWYGKDSIQAQKAANELDKAQQSLSKAMEGSTGEMTPAIKAQASLALFYQQTDQFAGDFANTSDQLANGTRILQAQFKDEAAALGTQLLPYVLQGVKFLGDLLAKFKALTPEQQKWVMVILAVVAVIGPLILIIGAVVTAISALIPVITFVAGLFTFPLIAVIAAVIAIAYLLYQAWITNFGGIQEKTAAVIEFVRGVIEDGMEFINDLTTGQLGELSDMWERSWDMIKTVFSLWVANIKLIFSAFKALFSGDFKKLGEILRQMWDNSWKMLTTIVKTAGANIMSALRVAVSSIQTYWASINWGQLGTNLVTGIANAIKNALPTLLAAGRHIFDALGDLLSGFFGGGGNGGGGGGSAGGGPLTCFIAGTMIAMADGTEKPIEEIVSGDKVVSYDTEFGRLLVAEVEGTYQHVGDDMAETYLVINDKVGVTAEHPLYVDGVWLPAGALHPGDTLKTKDGYERVKTIQWVDAKLPTYNIHVSHSSHNYFANGILAHNKALGGTVYDNKPYMVGERGPELFVPRGNGKIVSNDKLGASTNSGTSNYYNAQITVITGKPDPKRSLNGLI